MTSIDELFKKPGLPGSNKRKLEVSHDPSHFYKSSKHSVNGDAKGKSHAHASVADDAEDDDAEAGPDIPPEDDDEHGLDPKEDEEGRFFGGGVRSETNAALDYIEGHEEEDNEAELVEEKYDLPWLRKLALNFERRISTNAELRAKFEHQPQRFMRSEADLDEDIKSLSVLSEHAELYSDFAELGCVASLVSLLAHENADIAIVAIEVFSELIDGDVEAVQEQWNAIVDAALEAGLLDLLVQNLSRLDEDSEADRSGVYHILSILESLASQSRISEKIRRDGPTTMWLLTRVQAKETVVSQNKRYAAELLAILLQSSASNTPHLLKLDIADLLLQLVAPYRKRDPSKEGEEEEYFENLFDALTVLVDSAEGKMAFNVAEGVELCLIMLHEGTASKLRALRLLDHACAGVGGMPVCEKVVDASGLKTIFGMFRKKQDNASMELILGIICSMLRQLPGSSPSRIRAVGKWLQNGHEKISRIVQLRREFSSRLHQVDAAIETERKGMTEEQQLEYADDWFTRRLDVGIFCLQTIDNILAWLILDDAGARQKIKDLLAEGDESFAAIRATLHEQLRGVEGEDDPEGTKDTLTYLLGSVQEYT